MKISSQFDVTSFLSKHWQQKPVLIRQLFPDFVDPIDEHDLAGLAMEEDVDSRIVQQNNEKWVVNQGPFESFDELCQGSWSILVQSVDRYIEEVDALAHEFEFLPVWRLDDVMISFSVANAGVGAHIDQYDVFIIQGKGKRRWQVGARGQYERDNSQSGIELIKSFEPVIDEVLESGDAIYIPAGCPHSGVSLENCLNYSIGFRAPTGKELLSSIEDSREALQASSNESPRYRDVDIQPRQSSGISQNLVSDSEISHLKALLIKEMDTDEFEQALMCALSKQHFSEFENDISQPSDTVFQLHLEDTIYLAPGVKPLFREAGVSNTRFTFYIDGEQYSCTNEYAALWKHLFQNKHLILEDKRFISDKQNYQTLLVLHQLGLIELG